MYTVKRSKWLQIGIVISIISIGAIGCATLFVLSAVQTQSKETTAAGSKLDSQDGDPCNNLKVYSDHRPIRFEVDGDPDDLYCGWKTTRTMLRMAICLLGFLVCIFGLFCVIQRRKWPFYFFVVVSLAFSLSFFAAMCLDANDVRISNDWCSNGISGSSVIAPSGSLNPKVYCRETLYIWTCGIDIICCVIWLLIMALSFRYA